MMTIVLMFEQSGTARTLFNTSRKEHIVSKVGIKGIVNVKWIADDNIEIEESHYYI